MHTTDTHKTNYSHIGYTHAHKTRTRFLLKKLQKMVLLVPLVFLETVGLDRNETAGRVRHAINDYVEETSGHHFVNISILN
jgi:hypothetical protein